MMNSFFAPSGNRRTIHSTALWILPLLLTACNTPVPPHENLTQSQPRKLASSLKLPAEAQAGCVIAGLEQGAVPQGLTLLPNGGLLTSHYFTNGRPSCIVSTDLKTGKLIATFQIMEPDGSPHLGHVGGIATDESNLWIASDAFIYRGNLSDLTTNSGEGTFQTLEKISIEGANEVAFCSFYDGTIWAGEFAMGNKYPTPVHHHLTARDETARKGLVFGYKEANGFNSPEHAISIPDRTQGMLATENFIFLSRSYGRRNRSSIEIYSNPFSEPAHKIIQTLDGADVPLWFLDGKNHIRSIDLPPMSESIAVHEQKLLVLFESGAKKFKRFGKKPIDQLILLSAEELRP